jgi:hypothetical protein
MALALLAALPVVGVSVAWGRDAMRTRAAAGAIVVIVTGDDPVAPRVPFGVISVGVAPADSRQRFADAGGRLQIDSLPAGPTRVRVEAVGYRRAEIGATVAPDRVDTVRIALSRVRVRVGNATSAPAPACGPGDVSKVGDGTATTILDQLRINVAQQRLLTRGYPYAALIARELLRGSTARTADDALDIVREDSIVRTVGRIWRYAPGQLDRLLDSDPDSISSQEEPLPPMITLADLDDQSFADTHCFTVRGMAPVDDQRLLRIDFEPVKTLTTADASGSVYLDSTTFRTRRFNVTVARTRQTVTAEHEWETVTSEMRFREAAPAIPIVDHVETLRTIDTKLLHASAISHDVTRQREQVVAVTSVGGYSDDPSPLRVLAAAADSAAARYRHYPVVSFDTLRAAAFGCVHRWRLAWEASEKHRHAVDDSAKSTPTRWGDADPNRIALLHCHIDVGDGGFATFRSHIIESGAGKRAICPSWPLDFLKLPDEAEGIDGALITDSLPAIRRARDSLLLALEHAAPRRADDAWLVGQRVRFALDQKEPARAANALARCGAAHWWCMALDGYLHQVAGDWPAADSIFQVAVAAMPDSVRCDWTDLGPLFDWHDRVAYEQVSCGDRQALNTRIWWLSDPLYADVGNDRRAEHYARHVLMTLRGDGLSAERWEMRSPYGGDAVTEMLTRYGWPSESWWGGREQDDDHYAYLGVADTRRKGRAVFATAEYSIDRPHVIPAWSAIQDPTHAAPEDWLLAPARTAFDGDPDSTWWPTEHYRRREGMLNQLPEQHAMFRRAEGALLAIATHALAENLNVDGGDTLDARVIVGPGPDSMHVARARTIAGADAAVQLLVPSQPAIAAVEVPGRGPKGGRPVSRTRFGIDPPAPLSAMRPGEIDISTPAIIHPPEGTAQPVTDATAAIRRMYGNSILKPGQSIGVYWETYGISDRDTVDVTLSIHLRGGRDTIVIGWQEPSPGHTASTVRGAIPIQSRNITLDLSAYKPGDYVLAVSAKRRGVLVRAERQITIADSVPPLDFIRRDSLPWGRSLHQYVEAFVAVGRDFNPGQPFSYRGPPLDPLSKVIADEMYAIVAFPMIGGGGGFISLRMINPTTTRAYIVAVITFVGGRMESGCFVVTLDHGVWQSVRREPRIGVESATATCMRVSE